MGAKDPGLVLENPQNAFLHKVIGYIGINRCQRIIKEIDFLPLSKRKKRQ